MVYISASRYFEYPMKFSPVPRFSNWSLNIRKIGCMCYYYIYYSSKTYSKVLYIQVN